MELSLMKKHQHFSRVRIIALLDDFVKAFPKSHHLHFAYRPSPSAPQVNAVFDSFLII